MFDLVASAIKNRILLSAKCEEARLEKVELVQMQTCPELNTHFIHLSTITPDQPQNAQEQISVTPTAEPVSPDDQIGSSLVQPDSENLDATEQIETASFQTTKTSKTVTFDSSANDKNCQTDQRIVGRIITFHDFCIFRKLLEVRKTASRVISTKRAAKQAYKDFEASKRQVNEFKALMDESE